MSNGLHQEAECQSGAVASVDGAFQWALFPGTIMYTAVDQVLSGLVASPKWPGEMAETGRVKRKKNAQQQSCS